MRRISTVGQVDGSLARQGAAVLRRLCTTKDSAHHPEQGRSAPRQQRRYIYFTQDDFVLASMAAAW